MITSEEKLIARDLIGWAAASQLGRVVTESLKG